MADYQAPLPDTAHLAAFVACARLSSTTAAISPTVTAFGTRGQVGNVSPVKRSPRLRSVKSPRETGWLVGEDLLHQLGWLRFNT